MFICSGRQEEWTGGNARGISLVYGELAHFGEEWGRPWFVSIENYAARQGCSYYPEPLLSHDNRHGVGVSGLAFKCDTVCNSFELDIHAV